MSTITLILLLAIVAFVVVMSVRFLTKKRRPSKDPLVIYGFAIIGYNEKHLTREQALDKANDLREIRDYILLQLERIYGVKKECAVSKLRIDPMYHKPAEWVKIHDRYMAVNPIRPKHRKHFAEELHNLYRVEMYGFPYRYKPVDHADDIKREEAQEVCRGV